MVALRIIEMHCDTLFSQPASLKLLMHIELHGLYVLPVDGLTDCFDLLELVTGLRGVPSDKSQRLIIMSLREERMSGRIRSFTHIPTSVMLSDGLTKNQTFPQLMKFLSCGVVDFSDHRQKPVTIRKSPVKVDFTEKDLERIQDFDEGKKHTQNRQTGMHVQQTRCHFSSKPRLMQRRFSLHSPHRGQTSITDS